LFELLATTGLLGALSFLIFGLVVFSVMYITLTKCGELEIKSIMLGFFASAISLALYSFLFTFNNSLMLIAGIIILAAAAISIAKYPEKFKIIKLSFRSSPKYALALSAIFLVVSAGVVVLFTMGFKMYQADMIALAAIQNGDDAKKIEYLEKALQLAPYQDNYRINLAGGYIVAANRAFFEGKNQAEISSLLGTAFKQGQQAVQNSSNNAGFLESMALIYENGSFYALDSLTFAENTYKQMMPLDPNSPTPYLRIALINMSRAKNESDETEKKVFYEEAIKQYDEALKRKMDLAQAYYGKAVVYEKMGDLNTAIEQLANANVASNNNLDYQFELGRVYYNRGASQSQLSQVASNDLASGSSTSDNLSVSGQSVSGKIDRNKDIEVAEQLFLSILNQNKDHSNSLYALAVIYRKVGEIDKAEVMINRLLEVIKADKDGVAKIREEFADILK